MTTTILRPNQASSGNVTSSPQAGNGANRHPVLQVKPPDGGPQLQTPPTHTVGGLPVLHVRMNANGKPQPPTVIAGGSNTVAPQKAWSQATGQTTGQSPAYARVPAPAPAADAPRSFVQPGFTQLATAHATPVQAQQTQQAQHAPTPMPQFDPVPMPMMEGLTPDQILFCRHCVDQYVATNAETMPPEHRELADQTLGMLHAMMLAVTQAEALAMAVSMEQPIAIEAPAVQLQQPQSAPRVLMQPAPIQARVISRTAQNRSGQLASTTPRHVMQAQAPQAAQTTAAQSPAQSPVLAAQPVAAPAPWSAPVIDVDPGAAETPQNG